MRKVVIMLMGRSGSGKSYLERKLLESRPEEFYKVISTTTRPPREGEVNGVDYHFVNEEVFDDTDLVQTTNFDNNKYGSDITQYQTDHHYVTIVIVPESAVKLKEVLKSRQPDNTIVVSVYFNITAKKLKKNMEQRGDDKDKIQGRIQNDKLDEQFQTSGLTADFVVTDDMLNDDLPEIFYKWLQENTSKVYIRPKDLLNKDIRIGDVITYPVRTSSAMWMSKAIVYDIEYHTNFWGPKDEYRAMLKVKVPGKKFVYDWEKDEGHYQPIVTNSQVTCWERSVILPVANIHDYSHDIKLQKLMELRREILYKGFYNEDEENSKG